MDKNTIVYPYIPNTAPKTKADLMAAVDAKEELDLFDTIPEHLRQKSFTLPEPMLDEYSIKRHTEEILRKNSNLSTHKCFLGAGCAPHYVPAVCDEIIGRGELYTCYAGLMSDQGKLQIQFEYQSLMAELLDMDCMGMPQYDGGTAAGHALRVACRVSGRKKVLLPKSMSPQNLGIITNYMGGVDQPFCTIEYVTHDPDTGQLDLNDLKSKIGEDIAAVLIENPNFLGIVETQAREIGEIAKEAGAEFIVHADPISLGVIEAPGHYGATIACGDIHSLGLHMYAGCGVAGFVMVKDDEKYLFELKDLMMAASPTPVTGEIGFTWLAAFERTSYAQRDEASEYTGTNAGLWGVAAGVYLALMGPGGMREIGETIMQKAQYAANKIAALPGVELRFSGPFFKEFVVDFTKTSKTVTEINEALLKENIFGGYDLTKEFQDMGQCALYCVTEIHTQDDIDQLVSAIAAAI